MNHHVSECPLCHSQKTSEYYSRIDKNLGKRLYFQCEVCDLVFLSPEGHLNKEEERKRYNFHKNSPDDPEYVKFLNQLVEPVSKRLKEGYEGLDFGCGPGPTISHLLKNRGVQIEDYDPIFKPDGALLQQHYDFITCSETVEHFYQPRKEFELLGQLLKDRGILGVMTQMLEPEIEFKDWWYHTEPTHVAFYQPSTFQWVADWQGWEAEFPKKNVVVFMKERSRRVNNGIR